MTLAVAKAIMETCRTFESSVVTSGLAMNSTPCLKGTLFVTCRRSAANTLIAVMVRGSTSGFSAKIHSLWKFWKRCCHAYKSGGLWQLGQKKRQ